jgi:hypothetical protein
MHWWFLKMLLPEQCICGHFFSYKMGKTAMGTYNFLKAAFSDDALSQLIALA